MTNIFDRITFFQAPQRRAASVMGKIFAQPHSRLTFLTSEKFQVH